MKQEPQPGRIAALVGVVTLTLIAVSIGIVVLLVAAPPPESGEVSVTVTGQLSGDGYFLLNEGIAETEGDEAISGVYLRVIPTGATSPMPLVSVRVGVDGPRCTSLPGQSWTSNFDIAAKLFVLYAACEPYVDLSEFRRLGEVIVEGEQYVQIRGTRRLGFAWRRDLHAVHAEVEDVVSRSWPVPLRGSRHRVGWRLGAVWYAAGCSFDRLSDRPPLRRRGVAAERLEEP